MAENANFDERVFTHKDVLRILDKRNEKLIERIHECIKKKHKIRSVWIKYYKEDMSEPNYYKIWNKHRPSCDMCRFYGLPKYVVDELKKEQQEEQSD